jgi:hypothetical protein
LEIHECRSSFAVIPDGVKRGKDLRIQREIGGIIVEYKLEHYQDWIDCLPIVEQ